MYDSRTNRLATALMMTMANRNVHRTISPGVMDFPQPLLEVAVMNETVE